MRRVEKNARCDYKHCTEMYGAFLMQKIGG